MVIINFPNMVYLKLQYLAIFDDENQVLLNTKYKYICIFSVIFY